MKKKIRYKNNAKLKAGKRGLFLLLVSFFTLCGLQAQVTVGCRVPSAEGVLLDLKEHEADNGGATSDKGVLLPRVALTGLDSLEPLVKNAAPAEKIKHRGTVVYNMTVASDKQLSEGLYYWNGDRWVYAQDDPAVWKMAGNAGIDPAENYLGTSDSQPFVLKSNKLEGLRIAPDGYLYIPHAGEVPDAEVLVRNDKGEVGLASVIPSKVMLIQSGKEQAIASGSAAQADFNKAGLEHVVPVTWRASELVMNNVFDAGQFPSSGTFTEFTIKEAATYELSGFIVYDVNSNPYVFSSKTSSDMRLLNLELRNSCVAALNLAVQLKNAGGTEWKNVAAVRQLWVLNAISSAINQLNIPPTLTKLNAGDKLRMVFYRPSASWGLDHGTHGAFGIGKPLGLDILKSFKVTALE